jgi:hypothetical protein
MKKDIYVILAFHAHEPIWDLPGQLQKGITDQRVAQGILAENYVRKRMQEGRNIYRDLIDFASDLQAPVTLDISNELLFQLGRIRPDSFTMLKDAYSSGLIFPLYTMAHHTHVCLMNEDEIEEEIKLNEQFIHDIVGAPRPKYRGMFFTECSIDESKLKAAKNLDMEYVIFSHITEEKGDFLYSDPGADYIFKPFRIKYDLLALPRNFPVSQQIWKPITRWHPDKLRNQGFLMGEYLVFSEEYQNKEYLESNITKEQAIDEYTQVLTEQINLAPDSGLLLYIQDLELMDFGDIALQIANASWKQVCKMDIANIHFVTPDQYIDNYVKEVKKESLPKLGFKKISWAPEIRVLLRYDGHYPPIDFGEFRGHKSSKDSIFKKDPFIFWEQGSFFTGFFDWLLKVHDFELTADVTAKILNDEDYQIMQFPGEKRLPIQLRLMKRACNWGWAPDEDRQKRPFLDGFLISDYLLLLHKLYPLRRMRSVERINSYYFEGLKRLLEVLIDVRIEYLSFGLDILRVDKGFDINASTEKLDHAKSYRQLAKSHIETAFQIYKESLLRNLKDNDTWIIFLEQIREYCRCVFISTDQIQRAWINSQDTQTLINAMYKYLYDLYPPKFPSLIEEVRQEKVIIQ